VLDANEIDSPNQHANVNSKYAWLLAMWRLGFPDINAFISGNKSAQITNMCPAHITVYYILCFVVCAIWYIIMYYLISARHACQHLNDALAIAHKPTPCTSLFRAHQTDMKVWGRKEKCLACHTATMKTQTKTFKFKSDMYAKQLPKLKQKKST